MEAESLEGGNGEQQNEKDLRLSIKELIAQIDHAKLDADNVTSGKLLLYIGHILAIMASESGTKMRMLERLTMHDKEIAQRMAWRKTFLTMLLGLLVAHGWSLLLNYRTEGEAEKKRDQMIEQQQKLLELLVEQKKGKTQ